MESIIYLVKFGNSNIKGTPEPQATRHHQDEGKTQKCRGSWCLVLMTVCLGLICALLLVFNILQHITIISYKNTVEEFNQTINNTNLMIEKAQLQNKVSSLSQNKLELETRVNSLTAEKSQLQKSVDSLSQNKLQLETRVNNLTAEKNQLQNSLNSSSQNKLQLETRVNNLTAEKSQLQRSVDSLSQNKLELETRVNNLTAEKSQLNRSVDSLSQNKLELETRVNNLTAEKSQLQRSVDSLSQNKLLLETRVNNLTAEKNQLQNSLNSLSQIKLELESKDTSLSDELNKAYVKGNQCGWFFITPQLSWFDSRQYCKDRGGDLIILNTEVKQRYITSIFLKTNLGLNKGENVWIGLNGAQQEGVMRWVDNSPLNQGFWNPGEPNDAGKNEDCVELYPSVPLLNWNDHACTYSKKGICEK